MKKVINESGVVFGEFDSEDFFEIEKSGLNQKVGSGIRTVEFICLHRKLLLFLEAKTSCPDPESRDETVEKSQKYEAYFSEITDKFIDSVNLFASVKMGRQGKDNVGKNLLDKKNFEDVKFCFVLVITGAAESWLGGPKAELEQRLIKWRKIWDADVLVLNAELAKAFGIIGRKLHVESPA